MQVYYVEVLPFIAVPYTLTYTTSEPLEKGTLVAITVKNIPTQGLVKSVSTVPPPSKNTLLHQKEQTKNNISSHFFSS